MVPGTHGSTFGGNPLAMAVANAVLDVILEDGFLQNVETVGAYLRERLEDLVKRRGNVFTAVRGSGLMQGLICGPDCGAVGTRLFEEGLLTVIAGENVVRLLPPLNIETAHADEAVAILDRVAESWPADES
jgi:acetylornithine/N-succinyldiaminopimelate aminotransferase